ncbi:hypothetical protein CUMW_273010 [Citrus unshiu]|uniref:Uncharacterized protein n=1 Tax=Citrus unshiu TaxID=55188 RepID=A0A2H5MWH3_CITUN|nr:hypothetical protein CUMW_273010 [Citrus unshiu]
MQALLLSWWMLLLQGSTLVVQLLVLQGSKLNSNSIVWIWIGEMLQGFPSSIFVFRRQVVVLLHGSTCESLVATLAACKDKAFGKTLEELLNNITKLIVYAPIKHISLSRNLPRLIGIPPANFRASPQSFSTRFSLSPDKVRAAIERTIFQMLGYVPLIIMCTVGNRRGSGGSLLRHTPSSGKILQTKLQHCGSIIDAAYTGSACIWPLNQALLVMS